jgi:hypothetical protein
MELTEQKSPNKLLGAGRRQAVSGVYHTSHPGLYLPMPGKKKKVRRGSAQPVEKAHFGQENQRESKPFPLIFLAQAWLGFAGFG